jgi:hypothetical protein
MTRPVIVLVAVIGIIVGTGSRTSAHHSFSATYVEDQSITIEGDVVQFLFRNPHSFVHVNVTEKNGTTRRYMAEWETPGQLDEQGVNSRTLQVGDRVIITGNPGRRYPTEATLRVVRLRRPADGFDWRPRPRPGTD